MTGATVMIRSAALLALAMGAGVMGAHELQDNRATLVLRDGTHLSVTLFIGYADALHQALAPEKPLQEFLLVYAALKEDQLQKELLRAQARFQAATHVYLAAGVESTLTNWVWPDAKQVRALLQQRAMAALVDPNGHAHDAPVEIHADSNARQEVKSVQVRFPDEFQKVLVVAFRPAQLWVESKALSPVIKF